MNVITVSARWGLFLYLLIIPIWESIGGDTNRSQHTLVY